MEIGTWAERVAALAALGAGIVSVLTVRTALAVNRTPSTRESKRANTPKG